MLGMNLELKHQFSTQIALSSLKRQQNPEKGNLPKSSQIEGLPIIVVFKSISCDFSALLCSFKYK